MADGGFRDRAGLVAGSPAALNKGDNAGISSVSCTSEGSCAPGGYYTDSSRHRQAFVVTEQHGGWGKAIEVPGTANLNKCGSGVTASVSCAAPSNCAAGGLSGNWAFVVTEQDAKWGQATEIPGGTGGVTSVSCAAPSNCAAGGIYVNDKSFLGLPYRGFVVTSTTPSGARS